MVCHVPGQGFVAQVWLSVVPPGQSLPPKDGAGLVQARDLCCVPPPQVTEHAPNPLQPDHMPSAENNMSFLDTVLCE